MDNSNSDEQGDVLEPVESGSIVGTAESELAVKLSQGGKYTRFAMAAMGGIPWIGSFISAVAALDAEEQQNGINNLLKLWLGEHKEKIDELESTLNDIFNRFEGLGEEIQTRIQSEEYLILVRTTFRSWDQAETKEKRDMYKRLITNAGGTSMTEDDLVRLFIKWIDQYHESHFHVVGEIYRNSGSTRGEIWDRLHTSRPREDSSEADLYKYLFRELSMGEVIRQPKETDGDGRVFRKTPVRSPKGSVSRYMKSAFDDNEPYILTKLGEQFVHYVLTDLVKQIS